MEKSSYKYLYTEIDTAEIVQHHYIAVTNTGQIALILFVWENQVRKLSKTIPF